MHTFARPVAGCLVMAVSLSWDGVAQETKTPPAQQPASQPAGMSRAEFDKPFWKVDFNKVRPAPEPVPEMPGAPVPFNDPNSFSVSRELGYSLPSGFMRAVMRGIEQREDFVRLRSEQEAREGPLGRLFWWARFVPLSAADGNEFSNLPTGRSLR
jgi:hypothetical protein